jgi:Uncharacterized protein conserved in bacteria (DUF2188)
MTHKTYHVVYAHGGWSVRKGGSSRAKHFKTRANAIAWGQELSRRQDSVFVIHKKDGTVDSVFRPFEMKAVDVSLLRVLSRRPRTLNTESGVRRFRKDATIDDDKSKIMAPNRYFSKLRSE